MVNRIKRLFNKDFNGLHEVAYLLGVSALASQILALIRDRLFASKFGAGELLDIYYASFRIPDLIYIFIASLVAATVLIPFITEIIEKNERKELNDFLSSILTFFLMLMVVTSFLAYFFMPYLANIVVPGFSFEMKNEFVDVSRLLLFLPFFFWVSNFFCIVLPTTRR